MTLSTTANKDENQRVALANALDRDGFVVLHDIVSNDLIQGISNTLDPMFQRITFCEGDFYGARTKRFGSLLKHAMEIDDLIRHPVVLDLVDHVLGPWCDTTQLNLGQAIEIHPGAPAQFPHRDQDMWRGSTGTVEYLVNVLWPLSPFTKDNGATVIYPGTHGAAALKEDLTASPVAAECEPGGAIIFLGSTLHGGGANITSRPRRGVLISYCLGWLKPYENQWLVYPPDVARHFPPELAALVGYRQHRPNLGNYEGRCPSILLGDTVLDAIHPIDALRPDQEQMLADFVKQQRDQREMCLNEAMDHASGSMKENRS